MTALRKITSVAAAFAGAVAVGGVLIAAQPADELHEVERTCPQPVGW